MNCRVSVSMITYNHEEFIAQAIDSALAQKTDFDYEIVIGEDDSSDRTREIVRAYKEEYPEKIRLFLNDRKNVIYIDGRPTGRWNFVNNLRHTRGQYVALLEGDDYWTSPYKLQRQVDFLDSHPDCAICFHAVRNLREDRNHEGQSSSPAVSREIFTIEDLFEQNFMAACSVMFRNGLFGEFPAWYYELPMGDWPLHILNAQYGNIGYINQEMSVYRIHRGGIWSTIGAVRTLKSHICLLETMKEHLSPQYGEKLNDSIARRHLKLAYALVLAKDYKGARSHIVDLLFRAHVRRKSLAKAFIWAFGQSIRPMKRYILQQFTESRLSLEHK
jgi:glycosyltransferase involved in cell wall biosynthesis